MRKTKKNRPLAGITGENLDMALIHLNEHLPSIFPSINRYDYRITNAYQKPTATSLGDSSSEAKKSKITAPENITRILKDLAGCETIVLCGNKAQLLKSELLQTTKPIFCSRHLSIQALSHFKHSSLSSLPNPKARRQLRVRLWADSLISSITERHATQQAVEISINSSK